MAFTYYDAATLVFGSREFTTREFTARTGNHSAAKVLSHLKSRGLVERVGRGRYRCLSPEERPDLRSADYLRVRRLILEAPLRKAWTGPSAVEVWTGGKYIVSPTILTMLFHVAIPVDDMEAWRDYLRMNRLSTGGGKRIGAWVKLIMRENWVDIETVDDEPVISRRETVSLIRDHPALYGGAEELINDRPDQT